MRIMTLAAVLCLAVACEPAKPASAPVPKTTSEPAPPQKENPMPKNPAPIPAESNTVTTASGLQYVDLVVGTGPSPERGQKAVVHYTGWLTDGTKFDSSVDRGQPFQFPLGMGRVIAGWDEGVATMKVGGKRKLTIPPNLGYGARGASGVIPPNATLVFEVELLGIR